ncbi:hypothetical protein ES319_A09G083300v1 [Gossypium barbadense]|uniref:RING-type domain-containing protein n=2 Tax=Gossypium TaxID=3633 RepID=A0A5J5UFR6_GOSBA|nr:hypothetical protein ES319_A09G083300v1 [Gossypium barbadense]TYH01966.1 hypothetical protein ES288_A09G101700v1 [Gossypium darwinii]
MQHLIYWALIPITGTIAIAVTVFTLVMCGNCAIFSQSTPSGPTSRKDLSARLYLSPYSASSFKFSKELWLARTVESNREDGTECVVCLLGFEDDEVVRQLHRCKHSFHAPCIDMWMYSHSICPICRTPVDRRVALGDDFTSDDNSLCMGIEGVSSISSP